MIVRVLARSLLIGLVVGAVLGGCALLSCGMREADPWMLLAGIGMIGFGLSLLIESA